MIMCACGGRGWGNYVCTWKYVSVLDCGSAKDYLGSAQIPAECMYRGLQFGNSVHCGSVLTHEVFRT